MNRRSFLRIAARVAAGVAATLGLGKVAVVKSASKVEMLHTPWIDCIGHTRMSFSGPAAEQWAKDVKAWMDFSREIKQLPEVIKPAVDAIASLESFEMPSIGWKATAVYTDWEEA